MVRRLLARLNLGVLLVVVLFSVAAAATVYTVVLTIQEQTFSDEDFFGFPSSFYRHNGKAIEAAQVLFLKEKLALVVDFKPQPDQATQLVIALEDSSQQKLRPTKVWGEIRRPLPSKKEERIALEFNWDEQKQTLHSQALALDNSGFWVLSLRVHQGEALTFFEERWRYSNRQQKFIRQIGAGEIY